jgi:hypothetical protein
MVRSRMTFWTRGVVVGSMAALAAAIVGCVASSDADPDVDEMTAEGVSPLGDAPVTNGPASAPAPMEPVTDPEPDPWGIRKEKQQDPTDPDTTTGRGADAPSGGHHDET